MAFEKLKKLLTSQQTLDFNLRDAAEKNDIDGVKKWLGKGAKSTSSSEWKIDCPLTQAIKNNNAEMAKLLLESGADPNAKSRYGETTPFIEAAAKGNVEICTAMLAAKANVNGGLDNGTSPYRLAVAARNKPLIELLENAGAALDVANGKGWTPLFYAVANNDIATLERLLKKGVRTDRTDTEGRDILDVARAHDRPAALKAVQAFLDAQVPEWQQTGPQEVTHVLMRRPQGYRLTDIFNFETKERTLITHNYETGRDSVERGKLNADDLPVQQAKKFIPVAQPG
ncbi:MAG: ankyrin repeat domain-containing protein [Alphaproteobacteria bacterium]